MTVTMMTSIVLFLEAVKFVHPTLQLMKLLMINASRNGPSAYDERMVTCSQEYVVSNKDEGGKSKIHT